MTLHPDLRVNLLAFFHLRSRAVASAGLTYNLAYWMAKLPVAVLPP